MTDKQKTAVQWLWNLSLERELQASDFEQAIAMEREQHQRTYVHGLASWHSNVKFEDYYKNSFNNE